MVQYFTVIEMHEYRCPVCSNMSYSAAELDQMPTGMRYCVRGCKVNGNPVEIELSTADPPEFRSPQIIGFVGRKTGSDSR